MEFVVENNLSSSSSSSSSSSCYGRDIPDILLTYQSPSYGEQKNQDTFICDEEKDFCKINFDLRETFGGYIPSDYACQIDF